MLAGIRTFSKSIFAKIIFGVIALSFVIWGLNASMLNLGTSREVAEIGSQRITPVELDRAFQRSVQNMRNMFGPNFNQQQAIQMGLLNNTVQSLVSQKILREDAKNIGIGISDDKVREQIFSSDSFKDPATGQFSRDRFMQALYQAGYTENEFINGVRGDMMSQQVVDSLTSPATVPDIMARQIVAYRNEQRSGSFFALSKDEFANIPVANDATLRAYHEDNAAQFTAPESRDVTLATLSAADLVQTITVTEEEIAQSYAQREPEFQTPEKRTVEQILFAPNEEQTAREAYNRLTEGADFMAVAEDAGMTEAMVKLGEFTANDILPDLSEATFALEEGGISEPVETALGWHIIRVPSVTPGSTQSLDEVRDIIVDGLKQYKAEDAIYDLAATFDEELGAGTPIEDAARDVGARTYKLDGVVRGEGLAGQNVDGAEEINAKIFELENGEESFLEETASGTRYVVRVENVTPSALRPFDEVRDEVVAAWTAEERQRLMMEKAEELADKINNTGADIATLAADDATAVRETGMTRRTGRGLADDVNPAIAAALFTLEDGNAKAIRTGEDVILVKLDDIQAADINTADAKPVNDELKEALNEDILAQYLNYLNEEISVSVNNSVINELYTPTAAN
ncbi:MULTISPECIES: SurA N-terminal domain-containing protein [Thalassospira]|uniref:Parvulin-like PPIase n=1 Tax=Thalassospira profundimaris TaxID=502049 RepID=A0A367V8A1_9PROT|nr:MULTISPECIES: SurA N-terminal domain-containing protein [Thalassospira]KZB72806.1 peptidylprolyl isomerase [Thalassospira sp. MCCC 1A01148]MBR9900009.1 peptidylprolyl isomerase [Rhodospirillales bacterium]RCK20490.1 peptidylprolyl isomerase [Thalassospira profundimaris]